jgi:Zn finger protein HypA/HybF involved in hydrogenase expression
MFVIATRKNELYLLGALEVQRSGENWAEVVSLSGVFRIVPLRRLKWQLRFEGTSSPKLSRDSPIAMQVIARRKLSAASAKLLGDVLAAKLKRMEDEIRAQEGKTKLVTLSKRERDPKLRSLVLAQRGTLCEICGFNFEETYGEFAKYCVQVHHVEALGKAGRNGVTTSLDDVLVICPNCHSALHKYKNPSNWKSFQRACGLSSDSRD